MPFNDNQLFYAALYLTESLPGGEAFTDEICKEHGKPYLPMNAPQAGFDAGRFRPLPPEDMDAFLENFSGGGPVVLRMPAAEMSRARALIEAGVTRDQCTAFFKGCFEGLKVQQYDSEALSPTQSGHGFIELSVDENDIDIQKRVWPAVIAGLEAAGLPVQVLPKTAMAYVHDNGLLWTHTRAKEWTDVNYPGKPALGCSYLPDLSCQDLACCPKVLLETLYRFVDLSPGQSFVRVKNYGDPEKRRMTMTAAEEGEKLALAHYDTAVPLTELTDEEILAGDPKINANFHSYCRDFLPGGPFYRPERGEVFGPTDAPGVFRHLSGPIACMDVREEVAFGIGPTFSIARPGDKIISQSGPRVISRESIASGKVRFISVEPASVSQERKIRLQ